MKTGDDRAPVLSGSEVFPCSLAGNRVVSAFRQDRRHGQLVSWSAGQLVSWSAYSIRIYIIKQLIHQRTLNYFVLIAKTGLGQGNNWPENTALWQQVNMNNIINLWNLHLQIIKLAKCIYERLHPKRITSYPKIGHFGMFSKTSIMTNA